MALRESCRFLYTPEWSTNEALTGAGNKCLAITSTNGENISLAYHPEGSIVAVGTKVQQIY